MPDTNGHSSCEGAEYYQLWRSTGGVSSAYDSLYQNPPPLPPRAVHKPLHRMNALSAVPLKLPRRHAQKLSAPLRPEDCFGFEIVDVDEATNLKVTFFYMIVTSEHMFNHCDSRISLKSLI